ncbi:hypothetical protein AYR66_18990 [Noviherbaspirillum denitrificans]|uniref:protein-glutamate methylesterase n=1 Tax=Noviherbaspirillum denitrificans TaxID=1968433 RepID=A0A254TF19_9BURK|nr:hypothetical protein AYR66_18990 [Noviherbaspirillum denitrificans]
MIGTSAGGPDALRRLLKRLPADFPAPVLVVMHVGSRYSIMPRILERDANLPVRHAVDAEPIKPGVVLMAPPDRHLLVEDGIVRVTRGPKENFSRPAIDPLFRSAALYYRENAIGVILTGLLDDGTIGLQAIKAYGGLALVQDPLDADEPAMPRSAINHVQVDACLPVEELADCLVQLAGSASEQVPIAAYMHPIEVQGRFDLRQKTEMNALSEIAVASGLTCPECHGSLWEIKGSNPPNFRCHTGHVYTAQGLNTAQDAVVEEAIWAAVRALHEKQMLLHRLAASAEAANQTAVFDEHLATAENVARHAETLRRIISRGSDT